MSIFAAMKILRQIFTKDNLFICIGIFLFLVLLQPFGLHEAFGDKELRRDMLSQIAGECFLVYICQCISEAVTVFIFRLPEDYSKDRHYQLRRLSTIFLVLLVILPVVTGTYLNMHRFGIEHWDYFWTTSNGYFTLKWYFETLWQDSTVCFFIVLFEIFITRSRMNEYKIQELLSLNDAIENSEAINEVKTEEITISGESKDSLTVSPNDILYIESIANYLSIWYFQNEELKQKRIRNTLKNVEELLSCYSFLLHCHRAYLVNIHFITHVDGNASGCQLHLFSIDRTIPVSKANIEALRQALKY